MLFVCTRRISRVICFDGGRPFGEGYFEPGAVVRNEPSSIASGHFKRVPDPCDDEPPVTLAEVVSGCDKLLKWVHDGPLSDSGWVVRVVAERLRTLSDAAAVLPDAPPVPFGPDPTRTARTVPEMVTL